MTDAGTGRQRRRLTASVTDLGIVRQRAFLTGVAFRGDDLHAAEASLDELSLLTDTAGSETVDLELIRRDAPDPATFIGRGKVDELAAVTRALDVDVVVFDNALTPAQQRNLQKIFGCDVVDRVAVILDIFAQHATSREGMLQVELALLRYRLPRLRGLGTELSRLGGGIGTRGPGETKLEVDRRRIEHRIAKLERELRSLADVRATQRKKRRRSGVPVVALVGYTNAGKSTLLNNLTAADALVEDQLFSTLDSTIRRLDLPGGQAVLVSDTVGFVRNLPHELVEAFRSTLEEVALADVLIHVVDGADPEAERQITVVRQVLEQIGAAGVPEVLAVNKIDVADDLAVKRLVTLFDSAVAVSAVTGDGVEELLEAVRDVLRSQSRTVELMVPYRRADVVAAVHRIGEVLEEEHDGDGTRIRAMIPRAESAQFHEFEA